MKKVRLLAFAALLAACASQTTDRKTASSEADPFLWLEEVEGAKAIAWSKEHNERALARLKDDRFAVIEPQIRAIRLAKDRLPSVALIGEQVYNFWQDEKHVRGIHRRTTLASFASANPEWETVLDFDALAAQENDNWVYKGSDCLAPDYTRCMVGLSRGGKDATVYREFDRRKKEFVRGGFELPEAKSWFSWLDQDHLFVGTDFGPGSLTKSGYARIQKLWTRGTPLAEAKEVFRGEETDVGVSIAVFARPEGTTVVKNRSINRYEKLAFYQDSQGKDWLIPIPRDSYVSGVFQSWLLIGLRQDWRTAGKVFAAGSLLAMPLSSIPKGDAAHADLETVFAPTAKRIFNGSTTTKSHLILEVLDNVKGRMLRADREGRGHWQLTPLALSGNGMAEIESGNAFQDQLLASYSDFLQPESLYLVDSARPARKPSLLKQAPARFRSEGLMSEQLEAVSRDGTKIPYFVVRKKQFRHDGTNPTLLFGYGGFEVNQTPGYMSSAGKVWLEQGGVWVTANIRGGGEFGPSWHSAAVKENRQKSFDDFIAVAEDLIRRKISSPRHLGIMGGSNGGLLVGAVFVQRPDLFNAVVCQVPLLDMLRYHKLLAGASWMAEYGDPDLPEQRAFIERYSPYQNVKAGVKYPEVYFFTSTKDDRVHPGHARKMVAKMESLGHPVLYYENIEGGHGGSANLEQGIFNSSLTYSYLWDKLGPAMDGPKPPPGK